MEPTNLMLSRAKKKPPFVLKHCLKPFFTEENNEHGRKTGTMYSYSKNPDIRTYVFLG